MRGRVTSSGSTSSAGGSESGLGSWESWDSREGWGDDGEWNSIDEDGGDGEIEGKKMEVEDGALAVEVTARDTKVEDIVHDDEEGPQSPDDEVARFLLGAPVADEVARAGFRQRVNIAGEGDDAAETTTVRQVSRLVRSVEIDSNCFWSGVDGDQPLTEVRIVMVIDSEPVTRLTLLNVDEEIVKTASFHSIQKLASGTTEKGQTEEEEVSVTPRQGSASIETSGRTRPIEELLTEDHRLREFSPSSHSNEEMSRTSHDDEDTALPKVNKRRLFPIFRSVGSKSSVADIYNNIGYASSEPTDLDKMDWPGTPLELEGPLCLSRAWIQQSASSGKESRSTSGHTVRLHSRTASSSHSSSSVPPASISSSTAEQLGIRRDCIDRPLSHRHCEACKSGGHRLPSGSSSGSQTGTEGSDRKAGSGDKGYQDTHQICPHPCEHKTTFIRGLPMESGMTDRRGKISNEIYRETTNDHMIKCQSPAPYKMKPRVFKRKKAFPHCLSVPNYKENSVELSPIVNRNNETPRLPGHEYYMKRSDSSETQNSLSIQTESQSLKNIGQSQRSRLSFCHALQDKSNSQVNIQSPSQPKIRGEMQARKSSSIPSSHTSPKNWMRREGTRGAHSVSKELRLDRPESDPMLIEDVNKLEIYFADEVASGTYSIEIKASISLSAPDSCGWREFFIPGIQQLPCIEIPISIQFHIQSTAPPSPPSPPRLGRSRSADKSERPWTAEAQFNADHLFDVDICTPTQISGKFRASTSSILQLRFKLPVYELEFWDTSISLRTFPRLSESHGLRVQYHATSALMASALDINAEAVKYSFLVKNGFEDARECTLGRGEYLAELGDFDWQDTSVNHYTELTVIRHLEDLGKPLELSFALYYPKTDQRTVRLPRLFPKMGNVVSERVVLVEPSPLLVVEYPEIDDFSTWKRLDLLESQSEGICFDRHDLPRFVPPGLKDDLVIKIAELSPVVFRALQREGNPLDSEESPNLVWNLEVDIDKVLADGLECFMKFNIQAGDSDQVLTVKPWDWTPDLFLIGGRVATQAVGEWRKDQNGNLTLFKIPGMNLETTLEIVLKWYKTIVREKLRLDDQEPSQIEYSLPKIIGKSILGGCLRCNVDAVIHISRNGKSRDTGWRISRDSSEKQIRLPKMYPSYTIAMSLTGVPCQPPRSIRFNDEQPAGVCADPTKSETHGARFEKESAGEQISKACMNHHDRHISSTFSPRSREKLMSWVRSFYNLTWSLLRCAFTPFLFVCAFQFAVSRMSHVRRPIDATNFPSLEARPVPVSSVRSMLNLGSLAVPCGQPESEDQSDPGTGIFEMKELPSSQMTGYPLGREKTEDIEHDTQIESPEDPRRDEPTAEGTSVMDWIDRALGWKNITH